MNDDRTEADAIASLVRESALPIFKQPSEHGTAMPLLVNPRNCTVESLERFLPLPIRKRAKVTVRDHDSFIDYVKLHQEPGTILFAHLDTAGASFTAVLDYHLSNGDPRAVGFKPGAPGWGDHRCTLRLEHTPEWKAWVAGNNTPMDQAKFALFLEDNRLDITEPEAGRVIDIAKSLTATTGSKFKSQVNFENGDRVFAYEEQTTATAGRTGKLAVPEKLKLKLPVFINGPELPIEAWFRYRVKDGELVLFYSLIHAHKVIEAAVATSRAAIEGETKLQVHHGALEST